MNSVSIFALAVGLAAAPICAQSKSSSVLPVAGLVRPDTLVFGDVSSRALAVTPIGGNLEVGWFDADAASPVLTPLAPGLGVNSYRWIRSASTPQTAILVTSGSAVQGISPQLFQVTVGLNPFLLGTLAAPAMAGDWRLEALAPGNTALFLRFTTTGQVFRTTGGAPAATLFTQASVATGSLDLSPNGQRLAYPSGGSVALQLANATGSTSTLIAMPPVPFGAGTTASSVRDVRWIDDRFLVALIGPSFLTSGIGQLVRVDSLTSQVVFLTLPVSGQIRPNFKQLSISGDRQWITCLIDQGILDPNGGPSGQEQSAVAMRISDGVTTNPGGGYIVLDAFGSWSSLQQPRIQQRAGSPFEPLCVFDARPAGTSGPTFLYSASLVGDLAITDRATTNPSTNPPLTFGTRAGPFDVALIVGASLDRTAAGVQIPGFVNDLLLFNPAIFTSVLTTPSTDVVFTIPLTTSPAPLNTRFFWQSCWLSNPPTGDTFTFGRVTEEPIF